MTNTMFWFWMVLNILMIATSLVSGNWLWCAVYFAIGDFGQMITTYVEKNYGEAK